MTKAHPHRQVNFHLDTVDDADIIERIKAQPSMVGYVRELVRRDIHDERLDYAALKVSELQAENAKLRELVRAAYNCTNAGPSCLECRVVAGGCTLLSAMRELGIEVG